MRGSVNGRIGRIAIDPAIFTAVTSGRQTALIVEDVGLREGDELVLERTLGGAYVGPSGVLLVRVTHVHRDARVAEGCCLASVRGLGR